MTATRKVLQRFLNKHDLEGTSTPHQGGEDLSTPTHDVMVGHRPSSTFTHADYHTGSIHSSRSLSSGLLRHDSSRPSFYLSLNSAREPPSHQSLTSEHDGPGKAHEDPTPATSTPVTSTPGLGDSGLEDMGEVEFSTLLEMQQRRRQELAQENATGAASAVSASTASTASTASLGLEGGKGEEGAMAPPGSLPRKNLRGRSGQRRHTLASSAADQATTPDSSLAASTQPSGEPTAQPPIPPQPTQPPPPPPSSSQPSGEPSGEPSSQPSGEASSKPTQPSDEASSQPSAQPSEQPASQPSLEIRSEKRSESMDRESKAVETQPPEPRGDAPPPAVTASSRVFSFDDSLEKAEKVPAFSANQINRL